MTETKYTLDDMTITAHPDSVVVDDGTTRWVMSPEYTDELSVILAAAAKDAREIPCCPACAAQEVPC